MAGTAAAAAASGKAAAGGFHRFLADQLGNVFVSSLLVAAQVEKLIAQAHQGFPAVCVPPLRRRRRAQGRYFVVIGNFLKSSPSFPPPTAGHAAFAAPSAPPIRLLSSIGFRRTTSLRALFACRFRFVEFVSEFKDFLFDFCVYIHRNTIAVYLEMAIPTYPCKV